MTHGKIETLTINETLALFRDYGVPMSYEALTAWIDGGAVREWAVSARQGGAKGQGSYSRKIFKKPLVAWLDSLAGDVQIAESPELEAQMREARWADLDAERESAARRTAESI